MKAVLTIAGSDSSGGAGIQADLKTFAAHQLFGMSAITALTAQNTTGVYGVVNVDPLFVEQQIDRVFQDIRPAAVKIGMVSSPEIVDAIARALVRNEAQHVVVDPVMVATSGSALIANEAVDALVNKLFPLAEVITPNIPEAQVLAGMVIESAEDAESAATVIAKGLIESGVCKTEASLPAIMLKGGHVEDALGAADDLLRLADGTMTWLRGPRVETANTHGTGCTLSSAIACGLAQGYSIKKSCALAKDYVRGALASGLDLGQGSGPIDHMWEYNESSR